MKYRVRLGCRVQPVRRRFVADTPEEKKLTKALICNALFLPGAGHFMLGARLEGAIMMVSSLTFLIAPIVRFIRAFQASLRGQTAPTTSGSIGIVEALSQAWKAHWLFILICFMAVLFIWGFGMAGIALRMRRAKEYDSNGPDDPGAGC